LKDDDVVEDADDDCHSEMHLKEPTWTEAFAETEVLLAHDDDDDDDCC
jgi:hypothetical protein